jgi:NADH dehydrogenase [ubiquinone] 1 alpha subcomplex assembly factor 1
LEFSDKKILLITGYEKEQPLLPTKKMILEGLKDLKEEIIMWKDEIQEKLETDPILIYRPNEIDVYCRFNSKCMSFC